MTSSVAGFTLSNVLPESASTSLPSMSIRCSGLTFAVSLTVVILSSSGSPRSRGRAMPATTRNVAEACLGSLCSGEYLTLTSPSKTTVGCPLPAARRAGDARGVGPPAPEENRDPMFTISAFVDALTLEEVGTDRYRADSLSSTHGVVFGGQLLAQSVMAGLAGQDGKSVKTIHTVFARGASPEAPLEIAVEGMQRGG